MWDAGAGHGMSILLIYGGGEIWRAFPDSRNYRHKTASDIQQSIVDGYVVTAAASGGKELAEYKPASRHGGNRTIEIESK